MKKSILIEPNINNYIDSSNFPHEYIKDLEIYEEELKQEKELNMEQEYRVYKFYNVEGKRLAAFARVGLVNGNIGLEVFILRCSPVDRFLKDKAYDIYSLYKNNMFSRTETGQIIVSRLETVKTKWDNQQKKTIPYIQNMKEYHPLVFEIPLESDPMQTFLKFLESNYYRKIVRKVFTLTIEETEEEVLIKN